MKNKFFIPLCFPILVILIFFSGCSGVNSEANQNPETDVVDHTFNETDDLANIVILATGGTIAGSAADQSQTIGYQSAALSIEDIIKSVPGIEKVANISGEQFCQVASENIRTEEQVSIAKRVDEILQDESVDGIVITHGTDTMEETAYLLNLTVKSDKPIVMVGSMRPSTAISADGPFNLYNAVTVASSENSKDCGVLICMNESILAARDATKKNTFQTDAFNLNMLGQIGFVQGNNVQIYYKPNKLHTMQSEFNINEINNLSRVDITYEYSGGTQKAINDAVSSGAKGVVVCGTGDGSINKEALDYINSESMKVPLVRSSRTNQGIIGFDEKYSKTITSNNLTPQKARILLMLALTKTTDQKEIQNIMNRY